MPLSVILLVSLAWENSESYLMHSPLSFRYNWIDLIALFSWWKLDVKTIIFSWLPSLHSLCRASCNGVCIFKLTLKFMDLILNQVTILFFADLEASVLASNLDVPPDLHSALSLLSTNSWNPVNPGTSSTKYVNTKNAFTTHPEVNMIEDEQPLAQPMTTMLPFHLQNDNGQFQEFQRLKAPFQASFFDSTRRH